MSLLECIVDFVECGVFECVVVVCGYVLLVE